MEMVVIGCFKRRYYYLFSKRKVVIILGFLFLSLSVFSGTSSAIPLDPVCVFEVTALFGSPPPLIKCTKAPCSVM